MRAFNRKRAGSIRVTGGEFRGRELEYPRERILRPTMGRTREAVFNVLGADAFGSVFVDLFAGAGAVGIEALSRGAGTVHFVESSSEVVAYLRRNIERLSVTAPRAHVHEMDVEEFLARDLAAPGQLVFADPPYEAGAARNLLAHYSQTRYPALRRLVIEHRGGLGPASGCVRLDEERRYGDTSVSFFTPQGATA